MDRVSSLIVVVAIAGSVYFVKNIKISVSGANATEEILMDDDSPPPEDGEQSLEVKPVSAKKAPSRQPLSFQRMDSDPMKKMVALIQSRNLCGFIEFTQEKGLGRQEQLKALSLSLGDERMSELSVFASGDFKDFDQYQTLEAKSFLIAKHRQAFDNISFSGGEDFVKGMKTEDLEILEKIENLVSRDPGNLFFAMLRNDVYHRYTNVDEDTTQRLLEKVMATTRYDNPVHSMVRDLYGIVKSNVVQFYLAQSIIFDQPLALNDDFVGRSVWRFYEENMRFHINGLLGKALENVSHSAKTLAYETGVYNAFRNSLHYTEYENTPELNVFEASKAQPVYTAEELKLNFKGSCDPLKVSELEIKLRAL